MLRKAFLDKGKLAHFAAAQFVTQAQRAVAQRGQFLAAISGGGTPAPLYDLLAHEPYKQQVPWSQTHIFWGDERCVLPDQPGSNYKQAKEALLDLVPLSDKKIYRIHGELDPQDAAQEYADQLLVFASGGYRWPQFDLVLLGMGADGHTASLFPGSSPESNKPTMAVTAQYQGRPANRVTLTSGVFNHAELILFLVTGAEKKKALSTVLEGKYDPVHWPAQRIQPSNGEVMWLVDSEAAYWDGDQDGVVV
jgi:6-phosphogluconolactonase